MDRQQIKALRIKIENALQELAKTESLQITVGRATFSSNNVTFKLECAEINSGIPQTKTKTDFDSYCVLYNLKPTDMGKLFTFMGNKYELVGCKPQSPKFPILGKRVTDGKVFKFPVNNVKLEQ